MRKDDRFVSELPSGIIRNPKLHIAGDDFSVNDVVSVDEDGVVHPVFDDTVSIYGVVAAHGVKGRDVLIAAG